MNPLSADDDHEVTATTERSWDPALAVWGAALVVVIGSFVLAPQVPIIMRFPEEWNVPVAEIVSAGVNFLLESFREHFRALARFFGYPLGWLRDLLQWLPWPAIVIGVAAVAFVVGGWRLATFATMALLYIAVTGYWERAMYTLAVTGVAVPFSVILGFFIGIAAFRSRLTRRIVEPCLDLMQTIPPFAYLIPILVLFGLGPVVGMLATAIYATPPMVRNTMLGLSRVPPEVIESAVMSGSTRRQLLWWVQVPSSLGSILVGVNQSIMAGLSMVVIAAIVGGFPDIGLEVLTSMKRAQFGESILAGLVIVLLAMLMDRLSRGFAARQMNSQPRMEGTAEHAILGSAVGIVIAISLLAEFFWPGLRDYPIAMVFEPAAKMNEALGWITVNLYDVTETIKVWVLFYFLLPLKNGLVTTVRPSTWGFAMDAKAMVAYAGIFVLLAAIAWVLSGWRLSLGVAIVAMIYFFGFLGLPWIAFSAVVIALAWHVGSWQLTMLAVGSLLFIAVTGGWDQAMVSIQLCGAGVVISFLLGASLGIWAAHDHRVSAILRPVNDTLQTMPIFVFLIPGIMIFLVGEFTALVAIIMYATVPSIRYTEHGIRSVPAETVEAARAFGATGAQLLWHVRIPLALPEMMLGLNQTIMMGLAMVVVAALVGARGLGQEVMIALTWGDTGKGMVAGLSVALIAIVTDRLIQSWSDSKKEQLGLA